MKRSLFSILILLTLLVGTGAQAETGPVDVELVPAQPSPPPALSIESAATEPATAEVAPVEAAAAEALPAEAAVAETPVPAAAVPATKGISLANGTLVDWKDLDLSSALVSLAGPSALYVRNVRHEGNTWAFHLKSDDGKSWKVTETKLQTDDTTLPVKALYDLATLSLSGDGTLVIDGILVDGNPQRTSLAIKDDGSLELTPGFESGSVVGASLDRSKILGRTALELEAKGNERLTMDRLAQIGNLESELKSSREALAAAKAELAVLESRNKALQTEIDGLRTEVARLQALDLEAKVNNEPSPTSTAELPALLSRISALESRVETLEKGIAQAANAPARDSAKVLDSLKAENEKLMAERQAIENSIRASYLTRGHLETLKPLFTRLVMKGFEAGRREIGTWKLSGTTLSQTDSRQHFSRYTLPLEQKNESLLYRFKVRSTGKDWVGAGFHLFASDSPLRGYGHGESLLVWITRDPYEHNNRDSWLQVFKSSTDVVMEKVLDAAIEEKMGTEMQVEVLYQPKEEYISVSVNGVEKIRYKTWFKVNQGLELAFRTLDTAVFRDFEVWAMEPSSAATAGR